MSTSVFRTFCFSALLMTFCASPVSAVTRMGKVHLGFSGATLAISTSVSSYKTWLEHRQLTLIEPDGKQRIMTLKDASPKLGNQSLSLYHQDKNDFEFVLIGDTECVEIDPIRAVLRQCTSPHPHCQAPPKSTQYIGRFDWMNGYNPPHGVFTYDFRFLPSYDAAASVSCS